ncbi:MAG TPA: hypothetical protein VGJ97_02890 [Anaerolineaceae bacterium]
MSVKTRFARLALGLALVIAVLAAGFAITLSQIHTWGATPGEVSRTFPGDELAPQPVVLWTHAIDIAAPPEQVWPWIAQIGDTRGGFYSYTFIENLVSQKNLYHNATAINPDWQNPQPGQGIIFDMLKLKTITPGQSLLAASEIPGMTWIWLWQLEPQGTAGARLLVRMRIQVDGAALPAVATAVVDMGGFVMERGMLQGIKDHAERRIPATYVEPLGIVLWALALAAGFAAAYLFIARKAWQKPLAVGLLAVVVLFGLTFIQPALWLRVILDAALALGVVWAARRPVNSAEPQVKAPFA